jgi:RNA polymerase sigma factor (TIGR02999 family)
MNHRTTYSAGDVTRLLRRWHDGDEEALEQLVPLVYDELRRLAGRHLRGESQALTLQPTALVHEAYLRMVDLRLEWQGRVHFFGVAAGIMRRILVDLARTRQRRKRGGGQRPLSLSDLNVADPADHGQASLILVDEALALLEVRDARKARAVELRYFAGLTNDEIAEVLEISRPTVERDLRMARAWLSNYLRMQKEPAHS